MSQHSWPKMRWVLEALLWIAALLVLWLPGCGGFAIACRPWQFTERHFGFFGYYRARYSRNGDYFEGFEQESLFITVAASVVVTLVCAWRYTRLTRRCTLADQAMSPELLQKALAGSIPFTADEFDRSSKG